MYTDMTRMGIKVLKQLFFDPEKADEWLAIASLELQYEVGILNDVDTTAMMIYQERAFGLVDKLELVDVKLAKEIRRWLNMEEKKPKVQLVYKKSLFVDLVKLNHNFLYSTRNRENEKYQVYAFGWTEELQKDLARLTGHDYVAEK